MENNKSVYALKKLNSPESVRKEILAIDGVKSVEIDEENMTLGYEIDEWTSDYDVFTRVMEIADSYGCEFDFDRESGSEPESAENAKETTDGKDAPAKDEEDISDDEEYEETENGKESGKEKKKRKTLSERVQRIIELSVAVVALVAALFFEDTVQLVFLAIAFAVAGYDVIYNAIVKITKKEIISEELILSLAFFAAIALGHQVGAVVAVLLYSVASFALKTGKEIVDGKAPVYFLPEKCRKVVEESKAELVSPEEIVAGDRVFFRKSEHCLFDGTVAGDVTAIGFDGSSVALTAGDKIYAGMRVLSNVAVEVSSEIGKGRYDSRNKKAIASIEAGSRMQRFAASKSWVCLSVLLVFCLLLAFLPPIAYDSYAEGLYRWGYTATIIAALCSTSLLCGANAVAIFAAIIPSGKKGVLPADYDSAVKMMKSNEVYIDCESVLCEADNETDATETAGLDGLAGARLKEDCRGAALELKDFGKNEVMVTSLPEAECVRVCTENKIPEYSAEKNDAAKVDIFDNALKDGKIVVLSEKNLKKYGLTEENGTVIAYADGDSEYVANATVTAANVSRIPFIVKLAARTVKICKGAFIAGFVVKTILAVLALCGVAGLWWAVLADTLVGISCCVAAVLNVRDVF